jgi:hypothetical protein
MGTNLPTWETLHISAVIDGSDQNKQNCAFKAPTAAARFSWQTDFFREQGDVYLSIQNDCHKLHISMLTHTVPTTHRTRARSKRTKHYV